MDIEKLRQEFPVTANRIFFDHAKVSPLPRRVREAVDAFTRDACDFGTAHYAEWIRQTDRVRESFAQWIGARPEEVAFVKNTSEGISIVANGLDWREGDNVVIPNIEFPANVYPWLNLQRFKVETRFVPAVDGRVLFDDIVSRVDGRTRIVSVSSVECNSGFRNDLRRIGAFCREKDVLFCVDAIQSLGALSLDVEKDHIDFLAADGHKWLLSVEGLGGFYIRRQLLEKIHPAVVGWDSVVNAHDFMNYDFTFRPDARRFEEGSFNTLSIHAFGAALALLRETGIGRIEARIMELGDRILEHLRRGGHEILSSTRPDERSGIIAFSPDADLVKLAAYMDENKVSLTVRDGLVRISPHYYNNEDEIGHFFDLLETGVRL